MKPSIDEQIEAVEQWRGRMGSCTHKWKPHISRQGWKIRGEMCERCGTFKFSPSANYCELVTENGVTRLRPRDDAPDWQKRLWNETVNRRSDLGG